MTPLGAFAAFSFGLLLGWVAGLIGVGGGEFRIPVLLYVLKLPLFRMIPVNLLVGLLTVTVSFLKRFQMGLWSADWLGVSLAMAISSVIGAYKGAVLTGRIPERPVKTMLAAMLIVVGLKIMLEPLAGPPTTPPPRLGFVEELSLALLVGLGIGMVSGMFGVAGGEFRIPALMYVFGLNVVDAGSVSLLVSMPTIASGLVKHYNMSRVNRKAVLIAITMGLGSTLGSIAGAAFVEEMEEGLLKMVLGVVLILATVRMVIKH